MVKTLHKRKRIENEKLLAEIRTMPCCICGRTPADPSHIRTRGSGGPDLNFNVVPKCRTHHILWGKVGFSRFFEIYPMFKFHLEELGWSVENGKLWHPKLSDLYSQDQ